ncbi:Uncharacterised protein [Starkeya nomas]|uniref:Methyltransferase type 11 domain-containing protein n=1 Tax=Starkeya nomas TaxID=2666134 RepID=A0A5S9NZN6_9HYPH|nr:class I SAM-dependent methyltransferase [Starkeya nomas]CAA0096307.1 Uncharacterised protein [Starkeya nomas]
MQPIETFEPATHDTFDPVAYLIANSDVMEAGVDPAIHFKEFGANEGRRQVNRLLMPGSEYRSDKLLRFSPILYNGYRSDGSMPIYYGGIPASLSEYASESANNDFGPFVDEIYANPNNLYLDLGCGLRPRVFPNCLYIEVYPSITADIIMEPACTYPIADASLDGIGCFAVLEHVPEPWIVVQEMRRMLKPGGKVWIDWPFLQPVHGYPSHYFNTTREGLVSIFKNAGFTVDIARTLRNQTPDHTISWLLGKFVNDCPDENMRDRIMSMSVRDLLSEKPGSEFWSSVLDMYEDTSISEFACGNTLVAHL